MRGAGSEGKFDGFFCVRGIFVGLRYRGVIMTINAWGGWRRQICRIVLRERDFRESEIQGCYHDNKFVTIKWFWITSKLSRRILLWI